MNFNSTGDENQVISIGDTMSFVEFYGACHLRQRLILSILTGKKLKIRDVRSSGVNIGFLGMFFNSSKLIFF